MRKEFLFLVLLLIVPVFAQAALLNAHVGHPKMTWDSGGKMFYNSSTGFLNMTGTIFRYRENSSSIPAPVYNGKFIMNVFLNKSGHLVGNNNYILASGNIDADANLTNGYEYTGNLIEGKVLDFGFFDSGITDQYDTYFKITGGSLMSHLSTAYGAGLMNSLNSNFIGNFSKDFGGTAEGVLGEDEQFKFCSKFNCGNCFMADWLGNEPKIKYPHDCTVIIVPTEGLYYPKCVPTRCAN